MPASAQEEFVALVATRSLGAPYLFEPAAYRKGNATREPSDLAWWCRGTLFLINMHSGVQPYAKQVEHNLRQLRGWLRAWSLGEHLTGKNQWQAFDIGWSEPEAIVLLSVVNGADARAQVHHDWIGVARNEVERRLTLVASVPETVLLRLAQLGGSGLDLANFLFRLSGLPLSCTEHEALQMLDGQYQEAVLHAARLPGVRTSRDTQLDREIELALTRALRELPAESIHNRRAISLKGGVAVFNDLDWSMTTRLLMCASDMVRLVRDVPLGEIGPQYACGRVQLGPYLFLIGVADIRQSESYGDAMGEFIAQTLTAAPDSAPISISYVMDGRPVMRSCTALLAFFPDLPPSLVSAVVQRAKKAGAD